MLRFSLAIAAAALIAAPAVAAENCDQSLKDTMAAFKTNAIGPKAVLGVELLIKQAEDLCKQGKQAEAAELLRNARAMIGE
jgi:hypothetical protein